MFLNLRAIRDEVGARERSGLRAFGAEPGHTVIHSDLTVAGDLLSDGHIDIFGTVHGTVNSRTVTLRPGAVVDGTVVAEAAYICGTVTGPVRAQVVTIGRSARILGSVFHNMLTIEPGAVIEGRRPWRPRIDRTEDPEPA